MIKVDIQDAKTNLSRYLDQVEQGELLVICRHNQPVGELRPIPQSPTPSIRVPGLLKGSLHWDETAFAPMSEEEVDDFDAAPLFPQPLRMPSVKPTEETTLKLTRKANKDHA